MTPASMSRFRLVMGAATGLLMIACMVVIWANPQPMVGAHTRSVAAEPISVTSATDRDDPCDLVIGPARAICQTSSTDSVGPTAAVANAAGASSSVRNGVLLCSAIAIAAALGLIETAGRRSR